MLGPLWDDARRTNAPGQLDAVDVCAQVRAAADELVCNLRDAERATADWADAERAFALVETALARCLVRLTRTGLWGRNNQAPSNELWRIAGDWLQAGSLQYRARFKPLGYAGDYLMLSQICDGFVCDHPLGCHFDRYFQIQVAPQAVRSRTEQIASTLVAHCLKSGAEPYRVVSVGAGPARDIELALRWLPPDRRAVLHVQLLDLDAEALSFARRRLEDALQPHQLDGVRENLFRLHQRSTGATVAGAADFLICPGLFDYFDDDTAVAILDWFWERLAPGGLLMVGNFAPHCATRAYMEWIGNWYLRYRTPREFAQLAQRARLPENTWWIGVERFGVDLFLHVTKDGPTPGR